MKRKTPSLLLAAWLTCGNAAWGAQQERTSQEPRSPAGAAQAQGESKIRVEVEAVLVEATVKDRAGRVMGDLKREDFQLLEDGIPQEISHFSRDQLPLAVALVVDLSQSIEPFLRPLRYATLSALKALKAEDQVALFTFSTHVERRVELTRDKREVADQFEEISAGGSTNINGAVYEAARYLERKAPATRRVIVLVSDNVPTESGGIPHDRVVDAALEADAAVYNLKVPGRNPALAVMMAHAAQRGLVNVNKLTAETGGEIFDIEKEGSLFLAFQALIERLKTRYTLGYYPANKSTDSRFRKLTVKLQPALGRVGSDYSVRTKSGYFPRKSG